MVSMEQTGQAPEGSASYARSRTEYAIDLLAGAERRLLALAAAAGAEATVQDIGAILRTLIQARMSLELPAATDKRASARIQEPTAALLTLPSGESCEAILHDLSAGGALLECDCTVNAGEPCEVELPGLDGAVRGVVRATHGGLVHLAFADVSIAQVIAILKHIERRYLRY